MKAKKKYGDVIDSKYVNLYAFYYPYKKKYDELIYEFSNKEFWFKLLDIADIMNNNTANKELCDYQTIKELCEDIIKQYHFWNSPTTLTFHFIENIDKHKQTLKELKFIDRLKITGEKGLQLKIRIDAEAIDYVVEYMYEIRRKKIVNL